MKLLLISALVTVTITASHAQLGQTEAATTATFGQPLATKKAFGSNTKVVTYRTDAYEIIAGLNDVKTIYLVYKKRTGSSWSDDEIKSVLEAHRLGNERWHWTKDIITGHHGPAVHRGDARHIDNVQKWHIFAHDDYTAEYYPEKNLLLIWDASGGIDSASILDQNML